MEIFINNQLTTTEKLELETILKEQNYTLGNGVAIAVNNTVVPKKEWCNFHIQSNDKITIIKATQGG